MSTNRSKGPFFVHIENLPIRYTWQDLKDMIRKRAAHGVWTDMAVYPNGQQGGKGYARIQRPNEAYDLYKYLTENIIEGQRLRVHLWDTSEVSPTFIECNCGSNPRVHPTGQQVAQIMSDPGWQTFSATSPVSMVQPARYPPPNAIPQMIHPPVQQPAMQMTPDRLTMALSSMNLDPRNPSHRQYALQQWSARQSQQQQYQAQGGAQRYPCYVANSTGLPTNASQGVIRTEARGIFISGLKYEARTREIELHFGKAGEVVKVDLQKDPQTGKSKGNATIQYSSAEAAQRAIEMFHGENFQGMRMKVRRDKEATAISAPHPAGTVGQSSRSREQPTIVNGSQLPILPPVQQSRKDSVISYCT